MHRILLVEDAPEIQLLIKNTLRPEFIVTIAHSLASAQKFVELSKFDLILLDVYLPDGDSFKFCAALKTTHSVPVIFLSGNDEISNKVLGFSLGGSDYIVKPFSPLELRARIQARLRETHASQAQKESLIIQDLCFDVEQQRVSVLTQNKEIPLHLTSTEYKLLLHLAKHKDHVLSRSQLLDVVWGINTHIIDRTIDVHLSNLRKKLAKSTSKSTVTSIQRLGYQLSQKYKQ